MTLEDHRFLAAERGVFADGYTSADVDQVLGELEGAEMVVVWDRHEDGMFTGDSQIVGRAGDGPWRPVSADLWEHLTAAPGECLGGGSCSECGAECVVETDGASHHLTPEGDIDADADHDHDALEESQVEPVGASPTVLDGSTPLLADEPFGTQDLDDRFRTGSNVALELDEEDLCSVCGEEIDGDGADGRCGDCAGVDDPTAQAGLRTAAYRFVDTAVDHGDDYDDVDQAAITFGEDMSDREKGEALVAELQRFGAGQDDDEHDHDPAYGTVVMAAGR